MAMMGGGMMSPLGGAKVITLNDKSGADSLIIKDADGFVVFQVDSQGNLKLKGQVKRV